MAYTSGHLPGIPGLTVTATGIRTLTFEVPGLPVGKARARRDPRHNRWYTPTRSATYAERVRDHAAYARQASGQPWPLRGRYFVSVAIFAQRLSADVDNVLKNVVDACQGVLWDNDRRIVAMLTYRIAAEGTTGIHVHVELLEGA